MLKSILNVKALNKLSTKNSHHLQHKTSFIVIIPRYNEPEFTDRFIWHIPGNDYLVKI